VTTAAPKKRILSPEARAKIAAAQKKRWAKVPKDANDSLRYAPEQFIIVVTSLLTPHRLAFDKQKLLVRLHIGDLVR
jgi:hypothetical protein